MAIVYRVPSDIEAVGSDFLEEMTIGTDRMIPVYNTQLPELAQDNMSGIKLPIVTYPSDVFLGQVMEREILPLLSPALHPVPKVETALTLAAAEMAAIGIGVARVPESLAHDRLATGFLFYLSEMLPAYDLQVIAMRVQGTPNTAEGILWSQLQPI